MTTNTSNPRPDVDEMRAAYEASTKGEWAIGSTHEGEQVAVFETKNRFIVAQLWREPNEGADAAFIATAHNEMPSLLDYIAYLEGLCGRAANAMEYDMRMCAVDSELMAELWAVVEATEATASPKPADAAGEE